MCCKEKGGTDAFAECCWFCAQQFVCAQNIRGRKQKTNTNINTNTNANTYKKDPNNTKVRDWVFLLNIKDHKTQCLTGTPVLWRVMCKPPPLLCSNLAQLQSNSGQTWKNECFNLNHDKGNLTIFCRTSKNTAIEKWVQPQRGSR